MTSPLRCAIYTRVSSDAGLEQDFNSLEAQRESAEAYIKSQAHEGWRLVRERFDDGGYSGGSTDRPALQRLLDRIRERRVDVVVVYKVDRLTRSLADFAKLVELFDAHGVSFVSVTQAFNTTTSMGRLTLNVLLSFAQFEREVTGERIRDKIAASKKRGLWMGGVVPLGYRLDERKLYVDDDEAAAVRLIFDLYLELGSIRALHRELKRRDIRTRLRTLATGNTVGGVHLTNGPLSYILRNRHYLGEINHHGRSWPGEHPGAKAKSASLRPTTIGADQLCAAKWPQRSLNLIRLLASAEHLTTKPTHLPPHANPDSSLTSRARSLARSNS
jgi:site-specific DNA recombinase